MQKPQRPFVPQRTRNESRAQSGPVEFRIAPPFVHKEAKTEARPPTTNVIPHQPIGSISDFVMTTESPASASDFMMTESPASIADFLAPESSFESTTGVSSSDTYELPPIEHFTEAVDDDGLFGMDDGPAPDPDLFGSAVGEAESESFGWEETDWQRYDWRSAAALGETTDPQANSAWAQTDWGLGGAPPPAPRRVGESAAKAIADALDGIARRIREGDLVLPSSPASVPDPSTIAATLAALLGVRR